MNNATDRLNTKQPDVSLPLALLAAGGVAALFIWLKDPKGTELIADHMMQFGDINLIPLLILAALGLFNIVWIAALITSKAKEIRSNKRLPKATELTIECSNRNLEQITRIIQYTFIVSIAGITGGYLAEKSLPLKGITLLPMFLRQCHWGWLFGINTAFFTLGTIIIVRAGISQLPSLLSFNKFRLPRLSVIQDGIVLGTIHESNERNSSGARTRFVEWVYQGLRGLTGNIFLSGSIGSGKSQILLRFLQQILACFSIRPSLLAIDPKRTFVQQLRKIIEAQGKAEHLLWISLEGSVKFNPIWREDMLRNSVFTSIANSLRLASINFLGSSPDNRFWEQSSFNLLKNALIYCAAKYDYFTFCELYRALIQARDEGLAAELVDRLGAWDWNTEERDNITMAINYFKEEFSQMDQKIRTSILATATSFLNEFLEYRVSCILSPAREEVTLVSIRQAISEGKFICLYIENNSLARSIGTLFKLLYQEAVLERVNEASDPTTRYAVLIMDEYQDVATSGGGAGLGDDRYLAMARESKAITIAATQSVSSLENAIRSEPATREILQNFRTRIFGNSTDPKTIRIFQEPHGQIDRERRSHSESESAQNARPDLLFGGHSLDRISHSESISTHYTQEYPITAREFSRLRPFEAFAQVFDGVETSFEKLFLKPYFLKDQRTPHHKIMKLLRKAAQVKHVGRSLLGVAILLFMAVGAQAGVLFPNVCSVAKSSEFRSCMNFNVGVCMCGWPLEHPCAQISYYVPQTFIEVWPNSKDTFFGQHPAAAQLALHHAGAAVPFGVEDDNGTFAFQARAIGVPLASSVLSTLPCQGTRSEKPCFDLMSEDLGSNWNIGQADSLQPSFLAWSLSPKLCILKGAIESAMGGTDPSFGIGAVGCSFPLPLPKYPPSTHSACNGWGVFYPRYGVYHGASRAAAAIMIASRLKSIGTEVSQTVPGDPDEQWQMLYPQSSSCFKEGQNLGILETWKGVREEQRLFGKPNGYLFVIWKRVSCCKEIPQAPAALLEIEALQLVCKAIPGGGV